MDDWGTFIAILVPLSGLAVGVYRVLDRRAARIDRRSEKRYDEIDRRSDERYKESVRASEKRYDEIERRSDERYKEHERRSEERHKELIGLIRKLLPVRAPSGGAATEQVGMRTTTADRVDEDPEPRPAVTDTDTGRRHNPTADDKPVKATSTTSDE